MNNPSTIEQYISRFNGEQAVRLRRMYETIQAEIPDAEQSISYAMPTFKIHSRPVVYFGAFDHHIGFYATPDGHKAFEKELSTYKRGKGSVQFPIDKPLPLDLITRITRYRAQQVKEK